MLRYDEFMLLQLWGLGNGRWLDWPLLGQAAISWWDRRFAIALLAAVQTASADSLRGQVGVRFDLAASNRYVWRGIPRASGLILQPQLGVRARVGSAGIAAGAFESWELAKPGADAFTERGDGSRGLGELDLWAEYRLPLGNLQLAAGAVRYTFHGSRARGGRGSEHNTTELYAVAEAKRTYLSPAVSVWLDVGRVRGVYLLATAALPVLGWPFPPQRALYLDGAIGFNLGQGENAERPTQLSNYQSNGFTHARVGLTGDLVHFGGITTSLGADLQLNFDEAVRRGRNGRGRDAYAWVWVGATLAVDRRAEYAP
jgi:hypothetical protein